MPISGHTFYSSKDAAVWTIDHVYKAIHEWGESRDELIKRTEGAALFALANAPFYWVTSGEARLTALVVANQEKYVRVKQVAETFVQKTLRVSEPSWRQSGLSSNRRTLQAGRSCKLDPLRTSQWQMCKRRLRRLSSSPQGSQVKP